MRIEHNLETGVTSELEDAKLIIKTEEEIALANLQTDISIAKDYLAETEWVDKYKIRHDLGLEIIPEDSSKWELIRQRETYVSFLRNL